MGGVGSDLIQAYFVLPLCRLFHHCDESLKDCLKTALRRTAVTVVVRLLRWCENAFVNQSNWKTTSHTEITGHRRWPVSAFSGQQDNTPPACYMYRRTTLCDMSYGPSARCLNKCLYSVHFHYTLLDECAEFLYVCGNNQCMLLYKKNISLCLNLGVRELSSLGRRRNGKNGKWLPILYSAWKRQHSISFI